MKRTKVIEANVRVHEHLLKSGDYENGPHRGIESVSRVRGLLEAIDRSLCEKNVKHLDVGCGDGFIFECSPKRWRSHGIDVSEGMLESCAQKHPEAILKSSLAEEINYDSNSFDIITCFSFLDHLENPTTFYKEAFRLLRPGGHFYFGLSPNRLFSKVIDGTAFTAAGSLYRPETLKIEYLKNQSNGTYYLEQFGIASDDLECCEPGKTNDGGMDPIHECRELTSTGFKEVQAAHTWIMAQHQLEKSVVEAISSALPLTASAFKYFDLTGKR